jgi:hypothetical protein
VAFIADVTVLVLGGVWRVWMFGRDEKYDEILACVHGVADDSKSEDCHGESIAAVKRVASKEFGDGLVVVFWVDFEGKRC